MEHSLASSASVSQEGSFVLRGSPGWFDLAFVWLFTCAIARAATDVFVVSPGANPPGPWSYVVLVVWLVMTVMSMLLLTAKWCEVLTASEGGISLGFLGQQAPVHHPWSAVGRLEYEGLIDRLLVRDPDGQLRPASWPHALATAAAGLAGTRAAVLVGGRASLGAA